VITGFSVVLGAQSVVRGFNVVPGVLWSVVKRVNRFTVHTVSFDMVSQ
jgi:hypothetical protein